MDKKQFLESAKSALGKLCTENYEKIFERAIFLSYDILSESLKFIGDRGSENHLRCLYVAYLPVFQILTGKNSLTFDQFCDAVKKTFDYEKENKNDD